MLLPVLLESKGEGDTAAEADKLSVRNSRGCRLNAPQRHCRHVMGECP